MTHKPPTPQGISALLKRAGFERSESSATGVKGWRNHSEGYVVRGYESGRVHVGHEDGRFHSADADRQRSAEMEERYAQVIEAAGYAVERSGEAGGYFSRLIVTARKD